MKKLIQKIFRKYELLENKSYKGFESFIPIRITKGKYKNIIYCYQQIKIDDNQLDEKGRAKLLFVYSILDSKNFKILDEYDFVMVLGKILEDLMIRKDISFGVFNQNE